MHPTQNEMKNIIMNGWLCWSVFKGFDRILMLLKHRLYYSGKEFDRENLCTFKLRCICVHISRFCMILPLQIQAFRRFQGSTITGKIIDRNDTKLIIWLHKVECRMKFWQNLKHCYISQNSWSLRKNSKFQKRPVFLSYHNI